MAIDFPSSPSVGQQYTFGGVTYIYTSQGVWTAASQSFAPLASPVFTGDPIAPTPLTADNDTSIATTAFVKAAIPSVMPGVLNARSLFTAGMPGVQAGFPVNVQSQINFAVPHLNVGGNYAWPGGWTPPAGRVILGLTTWMGPTSLGDLVSLLIVKNPGSVTVGGINFGFATTLAGCSFGIVDVASGSDLYYCVATFLSNGGTIYDGTFYGALL